MKKIYFALMTILITSLLVACGSNDGQKSDDSSGESADAQTENTENGNESTEDAETEESTTGQNNDDGANGSVSAQQSESDIVEYELQIDLINEEEFDYSYDSQDDEYKIEIGNGNSQDITGEQAKTDLEELRPFAHIDPDKPLNEMMEATLSRLNIDLANLSDYDLETTYKQGPQYSIEHQKSKGPGNGEILDFNLSVTQNNNDEWEYDYERSGKAVIEQPNGDVTEGAHEEIEKMLEKVNISSEQSFDEIKTSVLEQLEISENDIQEFELEVKYDNKEEIKLGYELDD
ncbi:MULTISPECIES: YusW family protein [Allobacillus]|uniref:YusW-like protein n=1 Tax=Allobacillus salarius TaxID=1955272 RepID=A0A556PNA0_9BACI|nr:YusW family protein [Allobacillus salarius]TSJ65872.1 hypothetical protein FPQ13_06075 [Allobacillus salarius]